MRVGDVAIVAKNPITHSSVPLSHFPMKGQCAIVLDVINEVDPKGFYTTSIFYEVLINGITTTMRDDFLEKA